MQVMLFQLSYHQIELDSTILGAKEGFTSLLGAMQADPIWCYQ